MAGDRVIGRVTGKQMVNAPLVFDEAQHQRSRDAHRTESCWSIYECAVPRDPLGRADPSAPGW
jgi:hypothetical protein